MKMMINHIKEDLRIFDKSHKCIFPVKVVANPAMEMVGICAKHKELNYCFCEWCNIPACTICIKNDHYSHCFRYVMKRDPQNNIYYNVPPLQITDPTMINIGRCSIHNKINIFLCKLCVAPVCIVCVENDHLGHSLYNLWERTSQTNIGLDLSLSQIPVLPEMKTHMCAVHNQFHYYFCEWCQVPVCWLCIETGHVYHPYKYMEEFVTVVQASTVNTRANAKATIQAAQTMLTDENFYMERFKLDLLACIVAISDATIRYAQLLQRREIELKKIIEEYYKIEREAIRNQIGEFLSVHNKLRNSLVVLSKSDVTLNLHQLIDNQKIVNQVISDMEVSYSKPMLNEESLKFTPPDTAFKDFVLKFGNINIETKLTAIRNCDPRHRPIYGLSRGILVRRPGPTPVNIPIQSVKPWGICCDKLGNFIISFRFDDRIAVFDPFGILIRQFGETGHEPGQFCKPVGVTVNPPGHIVVVDKDNHRIQVFNKDGIFLFTFGKFGNQPGQFKFPWDVACNSYSQIAVADSGNHRIQLFNEKGVFLSTFCFKANIGHSEYINLRGICFTPDGCLIVTDVGQCRIFILDSSFSIVHFIGIRGTNISEFIQPQGVICDDYGNIIVADSHNNRIQVFNSRAEFLWMIKCPGIDFSVARPTGICLNPIGQIVAITGFDHASVHIY